MAHQIQPVSEDDVIEWPDGTWCYRHELDAYAWKSDDYRVYLDGSSDWRAFLRSTHQES